MYIRLEITHKTGPEDLFVLSTKLVQGLIQVITEESHSNNRLSEWVEGNNLLPKEQFGFRKNRRAVDCVYILNTVIEKARAEHSPLYICYVDLKKAFDNVYMSLPTMDEAEVIRN